MTKKKIILKQFFIVKFRLIKFQNSLGFHSSLGWKRHQSSKNINKTLTIKSSIWQRELTSCCPISPISTSKNVKIVRPNVMIGVQTPIPPLCLCEFMMVLPSCLSKKKKTSCSGMIWVNYLLIVLLKYYYALEQKKIILCKNRLGALEYKMN